jgi:hypothetical protein
MSDETVLSDTLLLESADLAKNSEFCMEDEIDMFLTCSETLFTDEVGKEIATPAKKKGKIMFYTLATGVNFSTASSRTPKSSRRRQSMFSAAKCSIEEEESTPKRVHTMNTSVLSLVESENKVITPEPNQETSLIVAVEKQESAPINLSKSLTKPSSPSLRVEKRIQLDKVNSEPALSTEEILFQRLEKEKQAEKQRIEKRQKLYAKLKANGFQAPVKINPDQVQQKKVTVPKTPNSLLEKKHGKKVPSALRKSPDSKKDNAKKHTSSDMHQPHGPTVPVPFHFETDKRISSSHSFDSTSNSFHGRSMTSAEIATRFFQEARQYESSGTGGEKRLTQPHSPKFTSVTRTKSFSQGQPVLTHDEQEAKEMEDFQKRPFKAKPVDRRIFESCGELGVPKVSVKPPTIPVEFNLKTEKRGFFSPRASRKSVLDSQENVEQDTSFQFKARPLPSFIKEAPIALPEPPVKKNFQPTVPVSPKFHALHHHEDDYEETVNPDKYKELRRASSAPARRQKPHHSLAESLQRKKEETITKSPRALTKHKEFHFQTDIRGELRKQQFQEQLLHEQEEDAKKREFKALELQAEKQGIVAPKTAVKKQLTEPQPFQLHSVDLHEAAMEQFHQQIMKDIFEKNKEDEKHKNFKAKALPKTTYEPEEFVIREEDKENIVKPLNIVLESDKRAEKRKIFDEQLKQQELNRELLQRQRLENKEHDKQQEILELRRKTIEEGGLLFKAKPVLDKDPYPVTKPCQQKVLTKPQTPNFKLKARKDLKNSFANSGSVAVK